MRKYTLSFSQSRASLPMLSLNCLNEMFLRTLSLTLGQIAGHAILFKPSLVGLGSSYSASLWLFNANDLETCSNNIHAP